MRQGHGAAYIRPSHSSCPYGTSVTAELSVSPSRDCPSTSGTGLSPRPAPSAAHAVTATPTSRTCPHRGTDRRRHQPGRHRRELELEAHTALLRQDNQRLTHDNTELREQRNSAMPSIPHATHAATPDVDRVEQTSIVDNDAFDIDPITSTTTPYGLRPKAT